METVRVFDVKSHYMVEIDKVRPFNNGSMTTTYTWDIYIADNDSGFRGKAVEQSKNLRIPWTTLEELDLLQEMIKKCQYEMEKW